MYEIYKIKSGDTLESIADKFKTTSGILRQINGIQTIMDLSPNNEIIVPILKQQPYQYYTVKKGDNLYDIARDNNLDYNLLLSLNGLDEGDYIYPNQTIILPKDGIGIYLTKEDDTLDLVLNKLRIPIEELQRENENIYLRPEQILVFRQN